MNVKFFKGTGTPSTITDGGIYFRTDAKIISLGVGTELVDFGGKVTDASYDDKTRILTISKSDGNDVTVDFSDCASATAMATALKARLSAISGVAGNAVVVEESQGPDSKTARVSLKIDSEKTNVTLTQSASGLKAVAEIDVPSPKAGADIAIGTEGDDKDKINVSLEETIKVMGVTVGNLTNGNEIKAGTSLSDILKQILVKEIDVYTQNPSTAMKITGASNGSTYEIGTSLSITPSHTYTDGRFKGNTGYSYDVAAGCKETGTEYFVDSVKQTDSPFTLPVAKNGSYALNCKTAYSASSVTPKKNNGTNSAKTIAAGTATSGNLTINGRYYAYMGYSTATSGAAFDTASIKALAAGKVFLNPSGATTLVSAAESNGTSIIIACPADYKLSAIANSLGVSILANFDDPVEVDYINGGATTKYKVYVYPITSGAKVAYKGVTISKA